MADTPRRRGSDMYTQAFTCTVGAVKPDPVTKKGSGLYFRAGDDSRAAFLRFSVVINHDVPDGENGWTTIAQWKDIVLFGPRAEGVHRLIQDEPGYRLAIAGIERPNLRNMQTIQITNKTTGEVTGTVERPREEVHPNLRGGLVPLGPSLRSQQAKADQETASADTPSGVSPEQAPPVHEPSAEEQTEPSPPEVEAANEAKSDEVPA